MEAQQRLAKKWNLRAKDLHGFTKEDPEVVSKWQLERVSLLVDFAYAAHPFYHKLYKNVGYTRGDIVTWDDYNALPTINKNDVIQNFELFKNANLAPTVDNCYVSITSGSSGQVLTAMFDQSMIDEDMMRCFRFYEQMLDRPRDKSEWLYQIYVVAPPFTSLNGAFPTFTISNECPPEQVLEHISKLKPAILSGLPSYLDRLGDLVSNPAQLGIKAVNTNSESSTKAQREKISRQFGATVYDEYSSVELGLIATQCAHEKYHIVEDNVRVDILVPDENGVGEIVATSLINSFMPFIRYRQGDVIKVSDIEDHCPCGNKFRHLESFMGRTDQFLLSNKIGKVPPDQVMALYDKLLLKSSANLAEFQIVQTKLDEIRLILVPLDKSKSINKDLVERFSSELKGVFKDPDLQIVITEIAEMPPEKSYKRRLIKCELSP